MNSSEAFTSLQKAGYKITQPRLAVWEVLAGAKKPLSAYDVQKVLKAQHNLSAITIYRVLELFQELHLVHRIASTGTFMKCSKRDDAGCHHFLICDKCHKVEEVVSKGECVTSDLSIKKSGFHPLSHSVEIFGYCQKCA